MFLNKDLFDNEKDFEIARLKMEINRKNKTIEAFKKYDERRKAYYSERLQRLGELETYMDEIEANGDLHAKLIRYKKRISYLEQKIQAHKLQEKLTPEEINDLLKNKEYKKKCSELQARVKNLSETISNLIRERLS